MDSSRPLVDAVDRLRERDPRFPREAYLFVVAALAAAVERMPRVRREDAQRRHLSGGEVVTAVVRLARDEFGPLAPAVFREWGVLAGRDIGAIVFDLVGCGQLSAREEDRPEDFRHPAELLAALSGTGSTPRPGAG
jgi:uncharacterized repeat protein (TIGR04138 family)